MSVIIPCFNQGEFLADAISSVLRQTYLNTEIVVIDDGSTDDTGSVARSFGNRVRYFFQENRGLSAARNAGVLASTGAYLQFLDCDDKIEPEKLSKQVVFLEANDDVDIVYGDARYFTTDNPDRLELGPYAKEHPESWIARIWSRNEPLLAKLLEHNICAVNCPLIRKTVFERVGGWDTTLRALEDWEYWIRCVTHGVEIAFLDSDGTRALVRWHGASMSHDRGRMQAALVDFRLNVAKYLRDPAMRAFNCQMALASIEDLGTRGAIRKLGTLVRICPDCFVSPKLARAAGRIATREVRNNVAHGVGSHITWRFRRNRRDKEQL